MSEQQFQPPPTTLVESQQQRWLKYGGNVALMVLAVILIAVLLIWCFQTPYLSARVDTTKAGLYSLKPQTVNIIKNNKQPIKIVSLYTPKKEGTPGVEEDSDVRNEASREQVQAVSDLARTGVPIFGICLGHQILAQALGGRTFKLKFGHRGANQPVKDLETGKVEITSQNHGFAVDAATLPAAVSVNRINLNDRTVEGMRHKTKPIFCVQYHPEASPGPHDSTPLFDEFRALIERS